MRLIIATIVLFAMVACMPAETEQNERAGPASAADGGHQQYEGQTHISQEMAERFGLSVASAGPAVIMETVDVFGSVALDPARSWLVTARFPGIVRSVTAQAGDEVTAGQELAQVESDESLNPYSITAPGDGVVLQRQVGIGEHTQARTLFRIIDDSEVWVLLNVFPKQQAIVRVGQMVDVFSVTGELLGQGSVDWLTPNVQEDQSIQARVVLENPEGHLLPGMNIQAAIKVGRHEVDLAVRRRALQTLDGTEVVFRQSGERYEARPVTLGRGDREWVEVLSGLGNGDLYVAENSYLVKADIEKDSASHDH